jgi:ADP-heptose:LPS heptosyltransferase
MNITIVEGPAEPNTKENFYIYFKNFINYIKIRTTFEFIHLVQNHGFYVGNDSGLTHLASFLGINGIAIFGTTDPWLWHPIPVIKCLYESREDGIFFPSFEFLRDYIRLIGF